MTRNEINNEYFDWLFDLVCENRYSTQISYQKLLVHLHNTEFTYSIPKDKNRATDGIDLRYQFAISQGYKDSLEFVLDDLSGPCSVLEMMVALALRCEETIMDDPHMGNRTGQWFWEMIVNLGLGYMIDSRFDRKIADEILKRFLYREYEPNGRGGLFTVRHCDRDLRTVEIWYQLCWYLDSIT